MGLDEQRTLLDATVAADPAPSAAAGQRQRLDFEFVGALDDVPSYAAAALARTARFVLEHSDGHTGQRASVRISLSGARLVLSVHDPECSVACLVDHTPRDDIDGARAAGPGQPQLVLRDAEAGGLSLTWVLEPPGRVSRRARLTRRWR